MWETTLAKIPDSQVKPVPGEPNMVKIEYPLCRPEPVRTVIYFDTRSTEWAVPNRRLKGMGLINLLMAMKIKLDA
jgi:hypothetical protein